MAKSVASPKQIPIKLSDYRAPDYLVPELSLHFNLQEEITEVEACLQIRASSSQSLGQPLVLNGEHLELAGVWLDDRQLSLSEYQKNEKVLIIPEVPAAFQLKIKTLIKPHENKSCEGLYKSRGMFCTQMEAEGFRRVTYFPDRPDVMSRYTVSIEANLKKYPVLLSNGNLIEKKQLSGGRHRAVWQDPFPKPCYLFALVAGDLGKMESFFVTRSGRRVVLRIFVEKGNEKRARFAMESLKHAMRWDEETFGLEYDLDLFMIVAVDDFNFGAMENKGLNIFNAQYVLADPKTATDQNFQAIEGVIGHEYFHNWTGDRVTCRDWFQLTLKEGLTVFRDQEFSADRTSRAVKRIEDVRHLKNIQFAEDAGPNAHPIQPKTYLEINNFYTPTVYQKGAEVIRMIETLIGKKAFKKGITKYFELFDGQAVTTDDFVRAMELASGQDLRAFRLWYDQVGTPKVKVRGRYDAKQKKYFLTVTQEAPKILTEDGQKKTLTKPSLVFPLSCALIDAEGRAISLKGKQEKMLRVSKRRETFVFERVMKPPVPSLLRNFSAPVDLDLSLTQEESLLLLRYDSDPVNRYETGQRLLQKQILTWVREFQVCGKRKDFQFSGCAPLVEAFQFVWDVYKKDTAFAAYLCMPPSESVLNAALPVCDFEAVYAARKHWMQVLAGRYRASMVSIYQKCAALRKYSLEPYSMGVRMFKNILLQSLFLLDPILGTRLAWGQFSKADNMTDSLAALAVLADSDGPERVRALRAFYQTWHKDPIVMNKWFAVQAAAHRRDLLKDLNQLEKDPVFDKHNPNKQRALYGTFAGNLSWFHDRSGSGYVWLTDRIVEIDGFNRMVAARLSQAFRDYARLDPVRRKVMRSSLQRILKTPKLSRDVLEIISNTLKSSRQ